MHLWTLQQLLPFSYALDICAWAPNQSPVWGAASAENLTNWSQNLPALGCCPVSFFSAFSWAAASLRAGASPTGCSGRFVFTAPSALLNGLCEAQGVEHCANTARVMGAVCTWVIPAKNICIQGAVKQLKWKHPSDGTLLGLQKRLCTWQSAGFFPPPHLTYTETFLTCFQDPPAPKPH